MFIHMNIMKAVTLLFLILKNILKTQHDIIQEKTLKT